MQPALRATWFSLVTALLCSCAPLSQQPASDYPPQPIIFEDAASHTFFYVETDRCHVSAIRDGKRLWTRDMCAVMGGARENLGKIDGIGADQVPGYVGISFNTGEFGRVRISDGLFFDVGSD